MAEQKDEWAKVRLAIGSRWAWLRNKITELNRQIYLLDHRMEKLGRNDHCSFASSSESMMLQKENPLWQTPFRNNLLCLEGAKSSTARTRLMFASNPSE